MNLLKREHPNTDNAIEKQILSHNQNSITKILNSRLGKCEVCDGTDALYTCPKCEVKTCSLRCSQIHKKELECNGIRDRTKYIPLKNMTKMDFMNDYRFLEECTRYTNHRKTDKIKRYTRHDKSLPVHLYKLRTASSDRKIFLKYALENFTKHKLNTTFYDWKKKIIYWRCEWIFTNAGNIKFIDEKCCENDTIKNLLDKYINPENKIDFFGKKQLEYYQAKGLANLKILLKSEGIKNCNNRYYELDCKKTLNENLCNKTIVEYPCIYVTYDDGVPAFDIIDSDEDVEGEAKKIRESMKESFKMKFKGSNEYDKQNTNTTDDLKDSEFKQIQNKRNKHSTELKSLLFSNEDDELSSESDDNEIVKEEKPENIFSF